MEVAFQRETLMFRASVAPPLVEVGNTFGDLWSVGSMTSDLNSVLIGLSLCDFWRFVSNGLLLLYLARFS